MAKKQTCLKILNWWIFREKPSAHSKTPCLKIEETLKYINMFIQINANYLQQTTNILELFKLMKILRKSKCTYLN